MPEGVTKQRRLLAPRITEVSGVDRPAHLRDGWIIKKSVDRAGTSALLDALGRGARMPKAVEAATASTLLKSLDKGQRSLLVEDGGAAKLAKQLTPEQTAEFTKAADAADIQPLLDQLAQIWSGLRDLAEKEDPDVPSTEVDPATGVAPVAPVAPDAAAVLASPALAKALGNDVVEMLKGLQARTEAAEKAAAETLEKSLDAAAVVDFEKSYGGLGLDAKAIAPVLRKLDVSDKPAADEIRKSLAAAKDTVSSQRAIIVKEFGRVATPEPDSASGQIETMAKSLLTSGQAKTIEQARAAAWAAHPDLYEAARNGAGGE